MEKYKEQNPNAIILEERKPDSVKAGPPPSTLPKIKFKTPVGNSQGGLGTNTGTGTTITAPTPVKEMPAAVETDMPPGAEPGKCYARCMVPDKYESREEEIVDKPATTRVQTTPATYKTVYDTIVIRPAGVKYETVPAVYETVTEDVLVTPATRKWEKGMADVNCLSANPADCQVMCLKEIPAVYKKVSRQVMKEPATRKEIPVEAITKVVSKKVIDQPAQQQTIEVPATYKKITKRELVQKGGYGEWHEVLCASQVTPTRILAIQKALKENGYDPGELDNTLGGKTKAALMKFQQDKNLPVGNLNMETLKALGVEK